MSAVDHYDAPYGYVRLYKHQCAEWGVDWNRDAIPYDWPGWELGQRIASSRDRVRHRGHKGCYRFFKINATPDENGLLYCANDLLISFESGLAWTVDNQEARRIAIERSRGLCEEE